MVTVPSELIAALGRQPWTDVVVAARYRDGHPSYGEALRAYAEANPRSLVHILVWKDKGTEPSPNTVVAATTAVFLWNHGTTTVGYANAGSGTDAGSRRTRCLAGFVFPDFDGIEIESPEVLVRAPDELVRQFPTPAQAVTKLLLHGDCLPGCTKDYSDRLNSCNGDRDIQTAQCDKLYGAGSADSGDADQLAECLEQANADYTNCVKAAIHRSNNCLALCRQDQ
jgi:hypothetical protein